MDDGGSIPCTTSASEPDATAALEAELRGLRSELQTARWAKGRFLANLSEELRAPLATIAGMAKITLDSALELEQQHALEAIESSASMLLTVAGDLLDLARFESDQLLLDETLFQPEKLIRETAEALAPEASIRGLDFDIEVRDLPPYLAGDPHRLAQILRSLLANAVKFTEVGGVKIRGIGRAEPGDMECGLRLEIIDTGIGMSPPQQDKICDSLQRNGGSHFYGGAGLGLAISQSLVRQMGGKIWADSEPGEGSTFGFEVTLPALWEEIPDANAPGPQPAPGRGPRILVVEDNPGNRRLVERLLEKSADFQVATADNGAAAVELVRENRYDLILMDIEMPQMDGLLAARRIRDEEQQLGREAVPIVALTAHTTPSLREQCTQAGIDEFLNKPIRRQELIDVIESRRERRSVVLVVAEDPPDRQILGHLLRKNRDLRLRFALDGDEAVASLPLLMPDLVLLDVAPPRLRDGHLIRRLRSPEPRAAPPVICIGPPELEAWEACQEAGCAALLSKPVRRRQLLETLDRFLGSEPQGGGTASAEQTPGSDLDLPREPVPGHPSDSHPTPSGQHPTPAGSHPTPVHPQ